MLRLQFPIWLSWSSRRNKGIPLSRIWSKFSWVTKIAQVPLEKIHSRSTILRKSFRSQMCASRKWVAQLAVETTRLWQWRARRAKWTIALSLTPQASIMWWVVGDKYRLTASKPVNRLPIITGRTISTTITVVIYRNMHPMRMTTGLTRWRGWSIS